MWIEDQGGNLINLDNGCRIFTGDYPITIYINFTDKSRYEYGSYKTKEEMDKAYEELKMLVIGQKVEIPKNSVDPNIHPNLLRPVDDLELGGRPANCLKGENIWFVGDLVQLHKYDLLKIWGFGRGSLKEVKERLKVWGLSLDMKIDNWIRSKENKNE